MLFWLATDVPFKEEQIDVVVFLYEEISQDPCRITGSDLVGTQTEINALSKVPQLRGDVFREEAIGDVRKDEEHPGVDEYHQDDLVEELAEDVFAKVQRSVDDEEDEAGEKHYQKRNRNSVVLDQWRHCFRSYKHVQGMTYAWTPRCQD